MIRGLPGPRISGVFSLRHISGAEFISCSDDIRKRSLGLIRSAEGKRSCSPSLRDLWGSTSRESWEIVVLEICAISILKSRSKHYQSLSVNLLNYDLASDDTARKKISDRVKKLHSEGRMGAVSWTDEGRRRFSARVSERNASRPRKTDSIDLVNIKPMTAGIYSIRHVSGAEYIGSSDRCILNRVSVHRWALRKGQHSSKKFQELWGKSEETDWSVVLLSQGDGEVKVRDLENEYLRSSDNLLNSDTDSYGRGREFSEERRQKCSQSKQIYWDQNPEAKQKLSKRTTDRLQEGSFGKGTWIQGPRQVREARERRAPAVSLSDQTAADTPSQEP